MSGGNQPQQTLRIRFTKAGKVRFVSHRDVARLFERALRKLRVPVAYSEGFSPRPKLSFGLALSVGHESDAEYLDLALASPIDVEALPAQLSEALPPGLDVSDAVVLAPGSPSLQQAVVRCDWHMELLGQNRDEIEQTSAQLLAADEILLERERKGKTAVVNVRPAIVSIEIVGPTDNGVAIRVQLATEAVSLRPNEFVGLFDALEGRVRRTHQWMIVDQARLEPIPGPSTRPLLEAAE